MDVKERAGSIADTIRNRRLESKVQNAEHDLDRLRLENETLRGEVERDRDRLSRLMDGLDEAIRPATPKKHRVRKLATLSIAAGGAYVMGAKAGRERYEQIREKLDSMKNRSGTHDFDTFVPPAAADGVERAADAAEHGAQKLEDVGKAAERKADRIEQAARKTSGS